MNGFPKSLTEAAEAEIRKLIIQGDLALGQRLTESELAKRFGMSKTPVREALQHLQREGLIVVRPRQGTFVFTFNEDDVENLRGLRKVLEKFAIQEAMRKNRGRLLLSLGENIKRTMKVLEERKIQAYQHLDKEFHGFFLLHADNPFLNAAYSAINVKLQVLWRLTFDSAAFTLADMEESVSDHRRIAECILTDRAEELSGLLDVHIRRRLFAQRSPQDISKAF